MAERHFRDPRFRVKVLQSVEALQGVEGAGRMLYFMSHTFAGNKPLAIAMHSMALTRRFARIEFV